VSVDIELDKAGVLVLFTPLTEAGRNWIENNVSDDNQQWYAGSLVCELRYAFNLAQGMLDDGLELE